MIRLLATAVDADTDEAVTIDLGRLDGSALSGAKTRALVAADFFRQVWFATPDGTPTYIVKDNIGNLREGAAA